MRLFYSRLASVEEKKNIRKAVVVGLLSLTLLIFLLTYGIPLVVKYMSFLTDLKKSSAPVEKNDTTPPAPPRFDPVSEFVNNQTIELKGLTEAGAVVYLFLNDQKNEVLADSLGSFSFKAKLVTGLNKIYASAKDSAGNESQKSPLMSVTFDKTAPILEVSSPADNSQFFGPKQEQTTITGKTEADAALTINDRPVKINDAGNFSFLITLSGGANTFSIKAQDKAGNSTEKTLTLNFSP